MYFELEKKNYAFMSQISNTLQPEPHMHSHIEIIFMEKDGKTQAFADDKSVLVEENDLFISFPNQIHYFEDIVRPMKAYVLIISPDMCPEFKEIFKTRLPESPLIKNAGNNPLIVTALKALHSCATKTEKYSETLARGALLMLLSEIFKSTHLSKISGHDTDILKEILNYCYENYTNDISLQSISETLHIGRYYISRLFSKRLNIGFMEYINSLRIRKACELLKSGEHSITEIAFAVGYNSVRSFNRCFRTVRGTSPRKYQLDSFEQAARESLL